MYNIGVDIGGTNIAVGIVDESFNIISKTSFKTAVPRSEKEICDDISNHILKLVKESSISMDDIGSIGIGVPGSANKENGVVEHCANLFFHNWHIVDMMQSKINKKVYIENDANAAAYAEYIAGSAKGYKDVVVITLGTGIGGGIIIDGKVLTGSNYNGAEIGHMVIKYGGEKCSCGRSGCFEQYASTKALVRQTKQAINENTNKNSIMFQLTDGNLNKVSGKTAFIAAAQGDASAQKVLDNYFDYLACGITNVINIFQPDILCIGGGISREGSKLLDPIKERIEKERYSKHAQKQTKISIATLGNDAGIIGAAMLKE